MSEKVLNALMRLFAMLANSDADTEGERTIVESFLKKHLNREQTGNYLAVYDGFVNEQKEGFKGDRRKRKLAVNSVKIVLICNQMNSELTRRQKFVLLLNFLEFAGSKGAISEQELELVTTVSYCFHISNEEFELCFKLSTSASVTQITDSHDFLIVSETKPPVFNEARFLDCDQLSGTIAVVRVNNIGIFFARYFGSGELFINGQLVIPGKIYTLYHGSSFHNSRIRSVYYSDISGCFFGEDAGHKLSFSVKDIEFRFRNQATGLHKLSFQESSGKMIGIMGGSGAGKSTLLNVLNGNLSPSAGAVIINGFDLHRQKESLEGVIGYVPQDDLLIEDLTVYQNLFYNAKLCFADQPNETISAMVVSLLKSLGLIESKDLKVGNPLENVISGGQRKRLNIALELIREPSVLFLDEPTSGLSSRDSENVMDLLKELTLKGKLVFAVIHQPSSEIFKMFDSLLILDIGGFPVYYGNPVESIVYFKTRLDHANAAESECPTCGNVNPEQVFNMIETKVLDENGNQTPNRRISPAEWNEYYNAKVNASTHTPVSQVLERKEKKNKKPNFFEQFLVFATRDVAAKFSNLQYLIINFSEAPLLALILASLVKYYKRNEAYVFFENKNIPAYLFMCVLVALFIGMMVSAEEIIRDRKILKRESFLNLSRGSYLLAKITILFGISAIQTLSFVLIGNYILEIHGLNLSYWLVLFVTSCFANMLGLNISSSFNSVVTIYILIPFLLIPQILLSGVLVKFHELNPKISNQTLVPIEGDIMASRWAFEALAVNQFMNNDYEKIMYPCDKQKSFSEFKKNIWVSRMTNLANDILNSKKWPSSDVNINDKFAILSNEISRETKRTPNIKFDVSRLSLSRYDQALLENIYEYLSQTEKYYITLYNYADEKRDSIVKAIDKSENKHGQVTLRFRSENEKISSLVKNVSFDDPKMSVEEGDEIIALKDPIFRAASNQHNIRSHFFAPRKYLFGRYFDTFWINIGVLVAMSMLLWVTLYFDALRKLIELIAGVVRSPRRKYFGRNKIQAK